MATLTVYASTDVAVHSADASWTNARAGTGTSFFSDNLTANQIGASLFDKYYVDEVFFGFDAPAAGLPSDATVTDAVLGIYGSTDNTTTDITFEVAGYDYGASVTTADWQDGTEIGSLTVLASLSSSGFSTAGYNDFTNTGAGLKSIVSTTGVTKIVMFPDLMRTGTAPTNGRYLDFWSAEEAESGERRPRLVLTYTPASPPAATTRGALPSLSSLRGVR